ncbi:MAG: aminotransferase class I/II-fold pyridoxal phosphate-dependent enzyme [Pseudomonadota bacterium]
MSELTQATPSIATRLDRVRPFRVVQVLERAQALARDGMDVIHLEVGEPDFPTPAPIVEAGAQALRDGATRYTPALGIAPLREAIAGHYAALGIAVAPERVIVTNGASGALTLAAALLLDPGDELLLPDPGYPCNQVFAELVGGRPVPLPVDATNAYQPLPEAVRSAWTGRTRALLVASPSNPSGSMLTDAALQALLAVTRSQGGRLIVDEIYQGLVFGDRRCHGSALALADDLLVINSFSKYFAMTGWRLGWMVLPQALVEPVAALAANLFIAPSAPAQQAALAAFTGNVLALCEQRRATLSERREVLLAGLAALGFGVPVSPEGAFYVLADLTPLGLRGSGPEDNALSGVSFCSELLEETGVALTPGIDFGDHGTAQLVRFAYTESVPRLKEALRRIEGFVRQRRR